MVALKGITHDVRMCSLSQERNCARFVYPRLTIRECKVPGKANRRVDGFQKSLDTEMGGKDAISPSPIAEWGGG